MYKKVLCALCIVIALFFIIPIVYLIWTREPSKEEFVLKGPFIAIYLRNDYTNVSSSVRLHDTPNSELIIDRSIWDTHNQYVIGQVRYKKSLRFECHANIPVKWEYFGDGGLISEVKHHNKREIKQIEDPASYWFETVLEFFNTSEQVTGKYVCRGVDVPGAQVFVYVYGKGDEVFISKEDKHLEVEPDKQMYIHCPISDPNRQITLREFILPIDRVILKNIDPSIIESFNPQEGFKILPNHWGSYLCMDEISGQTSGVTKLFKPRGFTVVGDYITLSSTNLPQNDLSLKILCEATEDITLNFINFAKFKRRQVYFFNESSKFPFTSRIKLRTEYFLNHSTVECVTTKDRRVLRVWKFMSRNWSNKTYFRFDNGSKGYECCTYNNETPRLTQATCYTPTECDMKKSCVKLESKCPYSQIINQPIYEEKPGCALAKVGNHPSGILECSYANTTKNYMYFYNKKHDFHNFTSSDFRKKKFLVKGILRVSQRPVQNSFSPNLSVTFDCYGAKFFLANGFQWAVKKSNGQLEYLINKSQPDEENYDELHEWVSIPFQQLKAKTVTCIAPILYSPNEWVNVSTKFKPAAAG